MDQLKEKFPYSNVTTPREHIDKYGWKTVPYAVVVLDDGWTKASLSLVWQCAPNLADTIWFVGPKASRWRSVFAS